MKGNQGLSVQVVFFYTYKYFTQVHVGTSNNNLHFSVDDKSCENEGKYEPDTATCRCPLGYGGSYCEIGMAFSEVYILYKFNHFFFFHHYM